MKNEGRVIIVDTDDSLAASRLLHPELHKLFSSALGSTFYAGIPCRNTLVLFSDRKALKARIGRRLRQDYKASPYPITPQAFLVTCDGIAVPAWVLFGGGGGASFAGRRRHAWTRWPGWDCAFRRVCCCRTPAGGGWRQRTATTHGRAQRGAGCRWQREA